MRKVFFDSSALVKLFVREEEPATTIAREIWNNIKIVYSSVISVGEVLSAFAKKKRKKSLLPRAYTDVCRKFIDSLQKSPKEEVRSAIETLKGKLTVSTSPKIRLLPLPDRMIRLSHSLSDMVKKYKIEFGDAWHLMVLLLNLGMFKKSRYEPLFVCSDSKFCRAVEKEGYEVLDLNSPKKEVMEIFRIPEGSKERFNKDGKVAKLKCDKCVQGHRIDQKTREWVKR